MPISPLDIRKKTFSKVSFRGLDPKEVKDFLEQVARDLEMLTKERSLLSEKVDELSAKLEGFTRTERAFQEAFVTAQQACTAMQANAKQEVKNMLDKARLEAERILSEANAQAKSLDGELKELKTKRLALLGELRGVLASFTKLVEQYEK